MSQRPASWAEAKARIAATPQRDFATRFRLAGFDPARDARFADWADIDFAGSDLVGFDFTGAKLYRAKFKGAKIAGARFEQAWLDAVNHDCRTSDPSDTIYGPHAPARLDGAARLREADDWAAYADPKAWRLADRPPADDYLFTGAIFQDAPFAPEMVVVPSGTYLQGDETKPVDGKLRREVMIAHRLAVGRFPVTFEEWGHSVRDSAVEWKLHELDFARKPSAGAVVNVSWYRITEQYVPWLNERLGLSGAYSYRLLSEAEWEFCCRAGTGTAYAFGDTIRSDQARFSEKSFRNANQSVKFRSFPPNAWGLHDMHGNVWEWCQDLRCNSYEGTPDNGTAMEAASIAKTNFRILRGGSWADLPDKALSHYRYAAGPIGSGDSIGFRLARTLNP